ncbi:methyltransferase family protein [Glaciihabitans tibetensis]|uniref:Methyltransferase family protein n=1 Tax=Glaciihabitans tibetensis TaxID=1266600 RepID=A0A2T0VG06_9MICO|nr:class I SAM-dependent methyltransferase [Glaciihabitans tibetensis]PRY69092.1 methyltransferase family protein [Glaciihabitans tibetensis]
MTEPADLRVMWDARYAAAAGSADSVWSISPNDWVAATVGPLTPGTAVDLGCGEGRNAIWLASRGWTTTGVDFSSAGIDVARARSQRAGVDVDWQVADATTWRAPKPVDLVVIAYLHLTEPELRRAITGAVASLAPGGHLVVIGHDRTNIIDGVGGPQRADILYTPELLADAVAGLTITTCERVLRPVETADGTRNAIDAVLIART